MVGYCVDLINGASIDNVTGINFFDVDPVTAGEGGRHEEVAGEKYSE